MWGGAKGRSEQRVLRVWGMQVMVTALEGVEQVAIDLEHHSYRYAGRVCCACVWRGGGGRRRAQWCDWAALLWSRVTQ